MRQGKARTARDWLFPFGGNNKCAHLYFNNITTGPPNYTNILVINSRREKLEKNHSSQIFLLSSKRNFWVTTLKSWPKSGDEDISALRDESFVSWDRWKGAANQTCGVKLLSLVWTQLWPLNTTVPAIHGMHCNQITRILESIPTEISDCSATLKPDTGNTEIHERIQSHAEMHSSNPQIFLQQTVTVPLLVSPQLWDESCLPEILQGGRQISA